MTTVLGIDTATSACSAALWGDGRILARRYSAMPRGQAEALMPMVAEVMAEAGLAFTGLDLVAVTVGPGAFTGLRIGLAAARGIALAAGLPVAGITTSEALAAAVPADERAGRTVLAAIESKRADLYVQAFSADLVPLWPVRAALPLEVAGLVAGPLVVVGDGTARLDLPGALAASALPAPDAAVVAERAALHWQEGTALPAEPLYLRPPDVTLAPP